MACHQFSFLERIDMLKAEERAATFLLNRTYGPDEIANHLPSSVQRQILEKNPEFYVIDGYEVARQTRVGQRINTIMQTCSFAISGVLRRKDATAVIQHTIEKTYGKRGESVVRKISRRWTRPSVFLIRFRLRARSRQSSIFVRRSPPRRPRFCPKGNLENHRRRGR